MFEDIKNKFDEVKTKIKDQINSLDVKEKIAAGVAVTSTLLYTTLDVPSDQPIAIDQPTEIERVLPIDEQPVNRQLPTNDIQPTVEKTQIIPETKSEVKPIIIISEETLGLNKINVAPVIKKIFTKKPRAGESYDQNGTLTYNGKRAQPYVEMQQEIWSQNMIRPEGVNALFDRRKIP